MNADLDLAMSLADLADRLTLARFRAEDLAVATKADMTPVSDTDTAVEAALRARISSARPTHGVLGEEEGADRPDADVRWILDPIDGTRNFVRGIPVFATLIALQREGEVSLGVASAPALRRRWWASRGEGAFADGRRIWVSRTGDLSDAELSNGDDTGGHPGVIALASRCRRTRGFGDFWQHVLVAEGAIDIAVDPEVSVWDIAAIQVIVEEAGGRLTDLSGHRRVDGGSAVSTNGSLHDVAVPLLSGDGRDR